MKDTNDWKQICSEYLANVDAALVNATVEEKQQILNDITIHLNERYHELSDEEQTWEHYQQILTDLGPVEDYAELLNEKSPDKKKFQKHRKAFWILLCAGIGCVSVLACSIGFFSHSAIKKARESKRPVVVKTFPAALDRTVDPDTTEITVTFDQPMMNFSWSWVGGGEHFPETTGQPRYDKERTTCTLPVKLKPGHWYWVGINSEKFVYFQTAKHIPAKPYAILFATADKNGNPTEIPIDYIEETKRVNSK